MKIRKDAWHLRLYRRAYIEDRGWTSVPEPVFQEWWQHHNSDPTIQACLAMMRSGEVEFGGWQDWSAEDVEEVGRWLEAAHETYEQARVNWFASKRTEYHAARAAELRERLERERMSLCPYFWSVVAAVVIYSAVVRPWRWLCGTLARPFQFAVAALGVAAILAIVGGIGYGFWSARCVFVSAGRGIANGVVAIPTVPGRMGDWAYERKLKTERDAQIEEQHAQWRREHERQEREAARKREEAARIAWAQWAQEHPNEAQRSKERDRTWAMMMRAHDAARTLEDLKFWAGVLGKIVGVGVAVAVAVMYFGRLVDLVLALFVYFVFIKFGEETERGRRFFERFEAWLERQRQRRMAFTRVVSDTWELIAAFTKATKERVCPFITVVDGEK